MCSLCVSRVADCVLPAVQVILDSVRTYLSPLPVLLPCLRQWLAPALKCLILPPIVTHPMMMSPHLSPQASPIPVTDLPLTLTDVNRKMTKALSHGSILVQDDMLCNNPWTDRWQTITQYSGRHCSLRRGAYGRHYINHLCDEILHLS